MGLRGRSRSWSTRPKDVRSIGVWDSFIGLLLTLARRWRVASGRPRRTNGGRGSPWASSSFHEHQSREHIETEHEFLHELLAGARGGMPRGWEYGMAEGRVPAPAQRQEDGRGLPVL